jgi:5'-3' exonuclease
MAIAFLPCLALIVFEIVRFIISRLPSPEVETIKKQEELPTFIPKKEREELSKKREREKAEKTVLAKEKKILTTDKSIAVSKSDEFTERMRQKKENEKAQQKSVEVPVPKSPEEVRDRPEFSSAARRRIEEDSKKLEEKKATEEAEKKPLKTEKPAPVIPDIAKHNEGEPAISQVFSDEKDKGYNIDDILADITRRK